MELRETIMRTPVNSMELHEDVAVAIMLSATTNDINLQDNTIQYNSIQNN